MDEQQLNAAKISISSLYVAFQPLEVLSRYIAARVAALILTEIFVITLDQTGKKFYP